MSNTGLIDLLVEAVQSNTTYFVPGTTTLKEEFTGHDRWPQYLNIESIKKEILSRMMNPIYSTNKTPGEEYDSHDELS
jgi:hypothetical protein